MNPFDRVRAYGADMHGIDDRFMGDEELYALCLDDLFNEPNLPALDQAMAEGEFGRAFEAAHALKGLSGNLGLTPLYEALCTLVEALRVPPKTSPDAEYDEVKTQFSRLRAFVNGEELPEAASAEDVPDQTKKQKKERKPVDPLIVRTVVALVVVVAAVGALFSNLLKNYRNNIATESASHLTEINYQIKLYIEEKIENDWKVAHSVANSFMHNQRDDDEKNLFEYLETTREIWGISNIIIYTEDGSGINVDGKVIANDVASDAMCQASIYGEYVAIMQSTITYTLPIETSQTLRGKRVVAMSVVQEIEPFLDNMDFSSFGGTAYLYLTQPDGVVVSKLTHKDAPGVFNIMSFISQWPVTALADSDRPASEMLAAAMPVTYLMNGPDGALYVVSTPIETRHERMHLFYFVPEAVVNRTLNSFSDYVVVLSVGIIAAFAVGAVLVFLFIYSARKRQFNQALIARERMFDLLIENSRTAFGLFTVDQDAPDYVSSNAERIIGEKFMVIMQTPQGLQMRNDTGTETEALEQLNRDMREWDGKSEFRSSYLLNAAAETPRYYAIELYPVDGGDKEYVGIAQDVTQMHAHEEITKSALALAERANVAKSSFLSNMSHDIRTPMNAIVNMTDFALESFDNPKKQREYLNIIHESSDHLLRLINDILDMSHIESGQTAIASEPFDLSAEMNRVCDIVRPLCIARRQTFITDFSGVHSPCVRGDQLKVSQILLNLLSNAVKFTPEFGAVRFTATELPSLRDGIVDVRFVVEDNGIGISDQYIDHIFEPFMRVDDRRVSRIEGTGLGLSICHSYATAMGGTIQCESEPGEGSVFTMELFFERVDNAPKGQTSAVIQKSHPFAGKRCLLCEDNDANRTIARTILERLGFQVRTAENGQEGVTAFDRSKFGYYDIIYMDIQMPVMDGYQATAAIRECNHPQAKTIPIVAMTANVFAEDIEKARLAGMNAHVGKPVVVLELADETHKLLHTGEQKA